VPPNEPPKVISWSPTGQRVVPGANSTANFSEDMLPSSINAGTFTLTRRGASNPVGAVVTYDSGAKKPTLNPNRNLRRGATYVTRVKGETDGVKDLTDNSMLTGIGWRFKVKR
jgi:hypothetical protein